MEVAVSIIGIAGFAYQALKAIHGLREILENHAQDSKSGFLHDLDHSASILQDVKTLCEQVQKLDYSLETDFRTASLSIQVEDCTRDLERWLKQAQRMYEVKSRTILLEKPQRAWKLFMNNASKGSRMAVREQLQWHMSNIKLSLSVFGR
jgi:hypothetical protein